VIVLIAAPQHRVERRGIAPPDGLAYCCGPSSGIASGSSGDRRRVFPSWPPPAGARIVELVGRLSLRFPNELRTVTTVSSSRRRWKSVHREARVGARLPE
jgi:hypothetical protein